MSSGINNEAHTESIRKFDSGATRNSDHGKYDYEAFLCPAVLERYAEFMHKHRHLEDGTLRDGDNWQKGIPMDQLVKSLTRHAMDIRLHQRGFADKAVEPLDDSICAVIFNCMAMLRHLITAKTDQFAPSIIGGYDEYIGVDLAKGTQDAAVYYVYCEAMRPFIVKETASRSAMIIDDYIPVSDIPAHSQKAQEDVEPPAPHFYVAGPMRGITRSNFPAFDGARDLGESLGYNITSPADLDRAAGIDPIKNPVSDTTLPGTAMDACIVRDLHAIMGLRPEHGDGLAVLPGYQDSVGAIAEIATANWKGLKVVSALDFKTPINSIMPMVSAMKVFVDWAEQKGV